MNKSKAELFLEDEIQYMMENVIEWDEYKKIKDKQHLKKYIKVKLLNVLYRFVDDKIEEEFENYKELFSAIIEEVE